MTTARQPNTERISLTGHKPLSHTTIHGWPTIMFGAFFYHGPHTDHWDGMYGLSQIVDSCPAMGHWYSWGTLCSLWNLAHAPWRQGPTPSVEYGA